MSTLYFDCEVDTNETNPGLATWEIVRDFNRIFGEITGKMVTLATSEPSFYVKLSIPEIEGLDSITRVKIDRISANLIKEGSLTSIKRVAENAKLIDLFLAAEQKPLVQQSKADMPLVDDGISASDSSTKTSIAFWDGKQTRSGAISRDEDEPNEINERAGTPKL